MKRLIFTVFLLLFKINFYSLTIQYIEPEFIGPKPLLALVKDLDSGQEYYFEKGEKMWGILKLLNVTMDYIEFQDEFGNKWKLDKEKIFKLPLDTEKNELSIEVGEALMEKSKEYQKIYSRKNSMDISKNKKVNVNKKINKNSFNNLNNKGKGRR